MFQVPIVVSKKFYLQLNVKQKDEMDVNGIEYDVTLRTSFFQPVLSGSKDFN